MADEQTQLFGDDTENPLVEKEGKSEAKKKPGSKKATKKPAKKAAKKSPVNDDGLILLPFSIGSLSRSLAACRISGMARGDESDDLQARASGYLVGFKGIVPAWALAASSFEGSSPVVVAVELDKTVYRDKKDYLEVDPVLPTSVVRYIAFASPETEEDYVSRIKRFPDVPLTLFETKVRADAFGALDPIGDTSSTPISLREFGEDFQETAHLSQLGGIIACLKDSLHIDNATDDIIFGAFRGMSLDVPLSTALYESLGVESGPIDKAVWDAAYSKIQQISAKEGVDVFRFMEEMQVTLEQEIGESGKQQIDQWASFSRAVLEGEKDMPNSYEDSRNNALRAILLFLICKGYVGLRELITHTRLGPSVRALAFALCGLFDRLDRLPRDMKGKNREELDSLSQVILDSEAGQSVVLEVSEAQWGPDFTMRSLITRNGKVFVERAIELPSDLVELFAKARRQNLMVQYDSEYRRFFFPMPRQDGPAGIGDKLFIEVMESTTKSRQARFYMPVKPLTARGLGKAGYENFLELAWDHCMSIGKVTIGAKDYIAIFGVQLIDTFDQEEFVGLLNRFQDILTSLDKK